jgi:ankyrin repeat protein
VPGTQTLYMTPLMRAVYLSKEESCRLLLSVIYNKAAWINIQSTDGFNAMHLAALEGNKGIIDLLLENGADLSITQNRGLNVLHLAAMKNKFCAV